MRLQRHGHSFLVFHWICCWMLRTTTTFTTTITIIWNVRETFAANEESVCTSGTNNEEGTCTVEGAAAAVAAATSDKENDNNNNYIKDQGIDLGVAQVLESVDYIATAEQTIEQIQRARLYMNSDDNHTTTISQGLKELCRNKHELCSIWAVQGECQANPNYMKLNCAPVCQSCDFLSVEGRCPIDRKERNIWAPGDLVKMFTRLTTEEPYVSQYNVTILSQPVPSTKTTTTLTSSSSSSSSNTLLERQLKLQQQQQPWVIQMENVISSQEAEALIMLGALEGYERSADVGKLKADGTFDPYVNDGRTSSNAWCQHECYQNEIAQRIMDRLSNITGIPKENSEHLQLLRYEPGQYYQTHHDYIPHHKMRQQGVRILTFYLYLSDVEEGGGTNFPRLNLTVTPKLGRAIVWPNVYNIQPEVADYRTEHQALPVIKGIKYGANAWMHQRNYITPHNNNCI